MNESHEIVLFKIKDTVAFKEQKQMMADLTRIIKKCEGFISREFFYDQKNNFWIDHVVWTNLDFAQKGADIVLKDPECSQLFLNIEQSSMNFAHYEKIG